MDPSLIDPRWPNGIRWFLANGLVRWTPWSLSADPSELEFAAEAFRREDVGHRRVLAFWRRQDSDDFAGLEVIGGKVTDRVLCFHPVFGSGPANLAAPREWDIVTEVFEDVFGFVARRVVPDMKDWATYEDARDL